MGVDGKHAPHPALLRGSTGGEDRGFDTVFDDPELRIPAILTALGEPGFFPPARRPRVLWVGLKNGVEEMRSFWKLFTESSTPARPVGPAASWSRTTGLRAARYHRAGRLRAAQCAVGPGRERSLRGVFHHRVRALPVAARARRGPLRAVEKNHVPERGLVRAVDLIVKKRDGAELAPEEIDFLVRGFSSGDIPDYQFSVAAHGNRFEGNDTGGNCAPDPGDDRIGGCPGPRRDPRAAGGQALNRRRRGQDFPRPGTRWPPHADCACP